jgi:glycine dehydrogenase subunit 1
VYLAALGPDGLRRVALLSWEKAHALAERLADLPGYDVAFDGPFFHEFVVRCNDPEAAVERLRRAGIAVLPSSFLHPFGVHDRFIVAVTEKRTPEELDRFVAALEGK